MSSGVGVDNDCQTKFLEMKLRQKYRYVIYRLSADNKEIVVDKTGSIDSTYDDFIGDLSEHECRWAVYDFEPKLDGDRQIRKLVFISWCPDVAHIRSKMIFTSNKDTLRRQLVGIGLDISGTEFSEISFETILEKVK
ncbi:cofilin [Aspergillus flavus]|uniref:Cofilin n=1 Tax=Aspergillus flavus (strain ATCC 200026 / FGSC A1120 / IAM 13836 / NRRL 3357 / JCM 12722 / SRRC 167) TaxID=332952 RepID=A0A7U2MPG4_ASPFN|nr:hypothetical protein AFLA_003185 [Aspergillus flavus NRRL3357]QRD87436.1 cofilin [Aspergillus flavus]UCK59025.1 hypothetical protein AFCA_013283 [Aspergillus flavus]